MIVFERKPELYFLFFATVFLISGYSCIAMIKNVVDEADGDTASHLIVWKLPQIEIDLKIPFLDYPVSPSLPEES
jgi:hypothetical protein